MRVIIPAKTSSTRVKDKNWRPFYNEKSLVDLNIEAMLRCGFSPNDIHISCEDASRLHEVQNRYGVVPLLRDDSLCDNAVPLTDWIRVICGQIPGDDDIVWSQVCDPLFDEHQEAISQWGSARAAGHDSLSVAHPIKAYLLDSAFKPVGWGLGKDHVPSQHLPQHYTFPFTLSVLTRDSIAKVGYHIGENPHWYVSIGQSIDIDSVGDFQVAQQLYALRVR